MVAKGFDGEFQSIYLLHSFRGRGLGRSLMIEMARHLRNRSMSGASCWVLRANSGARRFYESLAGQVVGERADQVDQGDELVEIAYGWECLEVLTSQ
jgi:ribosomal protein S18 acetylase RimI-like enzyme